MLLYDYLPQVMRMPISDHNGGVTMCLYSSTGSDNTDIQLQLFKELINKDELQKPLISLWDQ